jgi:[acyl-carrier-protein] S-malonyltransferase
VDVVLLFPGQGSQRVGMARDLAESYPEARAVLGEVDRALGAPLSRLCFEGPEEELTSTQNAQPALLAHGAALWAVLRDVLRPHVRAAAGHSLGEFTAHHAAGSLTVADAARLVRRRGELMYEGGVRQPGAMAAILALSEERVEQVCRDASRGDAAVVVPANYNSPDQLVISGHTAAVERAMTLARDAGAKRALRLKLSGAFHSPLMEVAADGLRQALDATPFGEPDFPVYANVTAEPTGDAGSARRLLLRQLTAPVRWTQLMRNLAARHPDALFIELGPGSVLTGLAKRIAPALRTMSSGAAADVAALTAGVAV